MMEKEKANQKNTVEHKIDLFKAYVEGKENFNEVKDLLQKEYKAFEQYTTWNQTTYISEYEIKKFEFNEENALRMFYFLKMILTKMKVKFNPSDVYYKKLQQNRKVNKDHMPFIDYFEGRINEAELLKRIKQIPNNELFFKYYSSGKIREDYENFFEENKTMKYITETDEHAGFKRNNRVRKWMNAGSPTNVYQDGHIAKWARLIKQHMQIPCVVEEKFEAKEKFIYGFELSYVSDDRMDDFIEQILNELPKNIKKKTEKKKHCKDKLKEIYLCENGRAPSWEQDAEWPYDEDGNPMIFVKSKGGGDYKEYIFKNKKTGELHSVEQFS